MANDVKRLTQALYGMFSSGDLSAVDELVSPDLVDHESVAGIAGTGPEVFRQLVTTFRSAFPDLNLSIIDMIADGDRVAVRFQMTGTHEGEFVGIPPTHRRFQITAYDIVRWEDEYAVEHWGQGDDLAMLQQLGLLPQP